MEQPEQQSSSVNFNFNFEGVENLPMCRCNEEYPNYLLPVMDLTANGIPYLKGWVCPACKKGFMFKNGVLYETSIAPERT